MLLRKRRIRAADIVMREQVEEGEAQVPQETVDVREERTIDVGLAKTDLHQQAGHMVQQRACVTEDFQLRSLDIQFYEVDRCNAVLLCPRLDRLNPDVILRLRL